MELTPFFKSIVEADDAPVVICDKEHIIVYMNPAAKERYAKKGGAALIGRSIFDCHNDNSNEIIRNTVQLFADNSHITKVYTYHNPKENKDVYMVALRDDNGELIGYYEKHEYRTHERDKAE